MIKLWRSLMLYICIDYSLNFRVNWTKEGPDTLLSKLRKTRSTGRRRVSCRPKCVH